jgi:hypothetical protein
MRTDNGLQGHVFVKAAARQVDKHEFEILKFRISKQYNTGGFAAKGIEQFLFEL